MINRINLPSVLEVPAAVPDARVCPSVPVEIKVRIVPNATAVFLIEAIIKRIVVY